MDVVLSTSDGNNWAAYQSSEDPNHPRFLEFHKWTSRELVNSGDFTEMEKILERGGCHAEVLAVCLNNAEVDKFPLQMFELVVKNHHQLNYELISKTFKL